MHAVKRVITPKVWRAALAQVCVEPPAARSMLSVILDAIEVGYAKLELQTMPSSVTSR